MRRAVLDVILGWTCKQRAAAFLVLGVAILAVFHARIYNGWAGPFDVEVRDLVAMEDIPSKQFVRVVRNGQPVHYTELEDAPFYEEEISNHGSSVTASFRYLDAGGHRMLIRVGDAADPEVIGLVDRPSGQIASHSSGSVFLDCEKSKYRMWALLLALAGVTSIFVGLDQLRRAYAKPKAERPLRLFT